jgi:enolase
LIIDSRGSNPTVEAKYTWKVVSLVWQLASVLLLVPATLELRDGDKSRFMGKGVLKAVAAT